MDHPALDRVLWHPSGWVAGEAMLSDVGHLEWAHYRGCCLTVRHVGYDVPGPIFVGHNLGYIDGELVGNRPSMPKICQMLFEEVDRRAGAQREPVP